MDRRDFVKAGTSVLLASVAGAALAADEMSGHEHHHHEAMPATGDAVGATKFAALVDAAAGCVKAGEVCLEHCLALLRTGDTSMARCSITVSAMLPLQSARRPVATARRPARSMLHITRPAGGAWNRASGAPRNARRSPPE